MTMTPTTTKQLLFTARPLERGEPYRCLDCGRTSPGGTYGPPGRDELKLSDGQAVTVELEDSWLCAKHSATRWATWRTQQAALPARKRRLNAFRLAKQLGYTGAEQFRVAEAMLRGD